MQEVTRTVYESSDGRIFDDREECLEHEKKAEAMAARTSYWSVIANPDLTEGRGWQTTIKIALVTGGIESESIRRARILAELQLTFGVAISFVQGCAPVETYAISEDTREGWLAVAKDESSGGWSRRYAFEMCTAGERGTALIVKTVWVRGEARDLVDANLTDALREARGQ